MKQNEIPKNVVILVKEILNATIKENEVQLYVLYVLISKSIVG